MTRFRSLALGLAAVLAVSTLGGLVYAHEKNSGGDRGHHAMQDGKHGDGKHAGCKCSGCKRHGDKHGMKHGMRGDTRGGMAPHFRPDPNRMARELAVMETAIGIRAEQLDTWRDFTDALQAMMPTPPSRDRGPAMLQDREPFWMAEKFADKTLEKTEAAQQLKDAVKKLRETLTPEQLERVQTYEDSIHARMRSHGWGHGGPGGMQHGMQRGDMRRGDMDQGDMDHGAMDHGAMQSDDEGDQDQTEMDAPATDDAEMVAPDEDTGGDTGEDAPPGDRDEL